MRGRPGLLAVVLILLLRLGLPTGAGAEVVALPQAAGGTVPSATGAFSRIDDMNPLRPSASEGLWMGSPSKYLLPAPDPASAVALAPNKGDPAAPTLGVIEGPRDGETVSGWVVISGWAAGFDPQSRGYTSVGHPNVFVDDPRNGEARAPMMYWQNAYRPDVMNALGLDKISWPGFSLVVDLSSVPEGEHTLYVSWKRGPESWWAIPLHVTVEAPTGQATAEQLCEEDPNVECSFYVVDGSSIWSIWEAAMRSGLRAVPGSVNERTALLAAMDGKVNWQVAGDAGTGGTPVLSYRLRLTLPRWVPSNDWAKKGQMNPLLFGGTDDKLPTILASVMSYETAQIRQVEQLMAAARTAGPGQGSLEGAAKDLMKRATERAQAYHSAFFNNDPDLGDRWESPNLRNPWSGDW